MLFSRIHLRMASIAIILIVVTVLVGSFKGAALAQGNRPLFQNSSAAADANVPAFDATTTRGRMVNIDFAAIKAGTAKNNADVATTLSLNLFDDANFTAVLDRIDQIDGGFVWVGHLQGVEMSNVTLVIRHGQMAGNISMADHFFQVRYAGGSAHVVREIDQSLFPPDDALSEAEMEVRIHPGNGGPTEDQLEPDGPISEPLIAEADDGSEITVMVLYTATTRAAAGGVSAMENTINPSIWPSARPIRATPTARSTSGCGWYTQRKSPTPRAATSKLTATACKRPRMGTSTTSTPCATPMRQTS
jgi:hypothetical protein